MLSVKKSSKVQKWHVTDMMPSSSKRLHICMIIDNFIKSNVFSFAFEFVPEFQMPKDHI